MTVAPAAPSTPQYLLLFQMYKSNIWNNIIKMRKNGHITNHIGTHRRSSHCMLQKYHTISNFSYLNLLFYQTVEAKHIMGACLTICFILYVPFQLAAKDTLIFNGILLHGFVVSCLKTFSVRIVPNISCDSN